MYESRGRHDVRFGLGSCVLIACAGLSCTPVAVGGEVKERGGAAPEPVGESEQAISAAAVFNVVDYGADPAGNGADDHPAIMAAIHAAAAAPHGGEVYFPRGEYDVSESIVLPRSYTRPLILRGDGRYVSLITTLPGAGGLGSQEPVIDFDPSQSSPSRFYGFRDLQISRRNDGYVFRHTLTDDVARLHEAVFERVIFIAALAPGEARSTDLVLIQGARLCTMNDVNFDGGLTGLVLEDSSHVSIRDSGTFVDHASTNGIRLVGGGSHSLYHTRIEALDGGTALGIEGGARGIANIQIDGLFGEGKKTRYFVKLEGTASGPVRNVVMKDVNVPTPWGPDGQNPVITPSYGLYVNDHVHDVRVLSGTFGTWIPNLPNGGKPIQVEGGARNIQVRMATDDKIEDGGLDDYAGVEAGATRVHVELIDGVLQPYVRAEGMIDTWTLKGDTAYVGASETVRAAPPGTITTILQATNDVQDTPPQAGQRVILLGTGGTSVLVSGAGNLRLATYKFHLCDSSVIQLVYDGENWQEVSRSVN